MFQPGDFVVYGSSGVCRVIQVGALEGKSADPTRQYYTLQPVFESERIYTPVDSGVFMRPAMTKEQGPGVYPADPLHREDLCTERNRPRCASTTRPPCKATSARSWCG